MQKIRKPPTETEVVERLKAGQLELPPLRFVPVEDAPAENRTAQWDALVEACWGDERALFVVECKATSTPKAFEESVRRAETLRRHRGACR